MLVHSFTTARYLREVSHPALERGLLRSGRSRRDVELCYPAFIVTGRSEKEWELMRVAVATQIGFYGSTPAYRGVLETHGWGELQGELNRLSKRGEWQAMGAQIRDEVLEEFAIVAEPSMVAARLSARFGDLVDRVLCSFSFVEERERAKYLEELRAR
jgi:alkanesulfonate monooxygenase SsuD/methylene tetrahydromethanopterin reductase-like flavin-dependent oxidoreductase (luciferase family)